MYIKGGWVGHLSEDGWSTKYKSSPEESFCFLTAALYFSLVLNIGEFLEHSVPRVRQTN